MREKEMRHLELLQLGKIAGLCWLFTAHRVVSSVMCTTAWPHAASQTIKVAPRRRKVCRTTPRYFRLLFAIV